MGFLNRRGTNRPPANKPAPAPSTPEPASAPADRDLERPLLSLVYALRTWGQYELRLGEAAERGEEEGAREVPALEQWARRTLAFSEGERVDFDALDRYVLTHRSDEQRGVDRGLRDLREALWTFAECFSKSLNEDTSADQKSRGSVERLRQAVVTGDVGAIRREAVVTAQTISTVISSRQQRQRDQIERLAAKLEDVSSALVRAKRDGERDALTGLFNRAAFDGHLRRMADLAVFMPNPPLLMVLDVDHFKWVNDRFGHDIGDLALRSVAARLGATCRRGEDFLARFGGDEFVGVLDGVTLGTDAAQADRILFAIREIEIPTPKEPLRLSCSLGMARATAGEAPVDWFRRADEALYRAKRMGRDRAVIADASLASAAID
jgi:diguanylate cyclase (GGDEF)-like protein